MPDNSTQTGTDLIATDEVVTLNGVALGAPLPKASRVKPGFGADGVFQDVSLSTPFPVEVDPVSARATARVRAMSFRTPGRAGTAGQRLIALFNPAGNDKLVRLEGVVLDLYQTVIKAVTVPPPIIRVHRTVAAPTNGAAVAKALMDTAGAADAEVVCLGDASADGTSAGAALTQAIPAGSILTQEYAPRLITAAGYEMYDRTELLMDAGVMIRPGTGVVVNLDYTVATQNPITDMWIVGLAWTEYV